jgi:hypothetical protein
LDWIEEWVSFWWVETRFLVGTGWLDWIQTNSSWHGWLPWLNL